MFLTACGTTDSTLREQGRSEAYVTGLHDGRHSGMQEAGNEFEHYIAASGTYTGYQVGKEVDKANHPEREAKKVLKGVNTDDLKVLEK